MTTTEPVALAAAVKEALSALVKVLIVFGIVQMTGEQVAALLLAIDPILALLAMIYARSNSTPKSAPTLSEGTAVTVTTPAGTPGRVTTL